MNVVTPRIEGNGKNSELLSIKLPETKRPESKKQTIQSTSRNSMSSFNLVLKSSIDFPSSRASKYFNDSEFKIPDKVETYRQTLMEEYKVKGHRRMKRFQSNGILPFHANILRKDSLLDVEISKKINQFKKTMFTQKCLAEKEERKIAYVKKLTNANDVLEKLKMEITRQQAKFAPKNRRDLVQDRDLDEFAEYVEWLNTDGKKKYEAHPIHLNDFKSN